MAQRINNTSKQAKMYIALELSNKDWKLGISDGEKDRIVTIEARNSAQFEEAIKKSKEKLGLSRKKVRIISCYEAGRDGFWIHRYLESLGIENRVVDSSSIEVSRKRRNAKTDRIDVKKLLAMLKRVEGGEQGVWKEVNVPSEEMEDAKRLHREQKRLQKERSAHINRIKSLFILHGISCRSLYRKDWESYIENVVQWNGEKLAADIQMEIKREWKRFQMAHQQLLEINAEKRRRIQQSDNPLIRQVVALMEVSGIGLNSAWLLVMELYGWRKFKNRRQLGSIAGLTGTPYNSGDSVRDQGISKSGIRAVRALIIELSWLWLRYQPQSKLTRWYIERFAGGGKRMRRVGIVAVARRLLIDLWRYLEEGVIPQGAKLKG